MRDATLAYTAPFLAFVALMAAEHGLGLPAQALFPVRCFVTLAILGLLSRKVVSLRATRPLASAIAGAAVFLIWIAPDALFGYRQHWLFSNSVVGSARNSVPPALQHNLAFALLRAVSSTALVPVIEELFWRGWLMRWLIDRHFLKVPMGQYTPSAFWTVVVLFASEHGPYWDLGLAAGVIYNLWVIRTKSLADSIVAHAVTNGLLSLYVLATRQWQYWL